MTMEKSVLFYSAEILFKSVLTVGKPFLIKMGCCISLLNTMVTTPYDSIKTFTYKWGYNSDKSILRLYFPVIFR